MALEGSIQEFGLAEIFQLILIQKKEGILTLTEGKTTVSVYFKEGQIVRAGDGDEDEGFGNTLIKSQKITTDQLKKGLLEKKTKKQPLAATLVALGYISPADHKKLHRLIAEETVFQLFTWKTGQYKFEQREILYDPELIEPLSTEFTLMEAMRQIDEWPLLLKKIPSREAVFEMIQTDASDSSDPGPDGEKKGSSRDSVESFGSLADPSDSEKEVNSVSRWIDGERTVQQIVDISEMGAFSVYKELSDLLSGGKVRVKTGREGSGSSGHLTIKKLARSQALFKALLGGMAIAASIALFIFSYPSISFTLYTAAAPIAEVRRLSVWNERDLIHFALDLYYLKHGRFPTSLHQLAGDGFLMTEKDRKIDLGKWTYQPEEKTFKLNPK
jgi:hypothetical protein